MGHIEPRERKGLDPKSRVSVKGRVFEFGVNQKNIGGKDERSEYLGRKKGPHSLDMV